MDCILFVLGLIMLALIVFAHNVRCCRKHGVVVHLFVLGWDNAFLDLDSSFSGSLPISA